LLITDSSADEPKSRVISMKDTAVRLIQEQDSLAAVEHLASQTDQLAATKAFSEAMRHCYWKEKNLSRAVALGRAGLQYGLTAALPFQTSDPKLAHELRSAAKGMAYDLASFTWTGWNEPGISITESDLRIGLDAARVNLRLAIELKKDALPLSRAHWILGAQQLAARQYLDAMQSFQKSSEFAKSANNEAEELLGLGFAALVQVVRTQGASGRDDLEAIKKKLLPLTDGEFFSGQIDTAHQVFSK